MKYKLSEEEKAYFIKVCNESASMAQASAKLNMHFNTFRRMAISLNCYHTNQAGKGIKKKSSTIYPLSDILNGKYPEYPTYKLKLRLFKEGLLEDKCSRCGWSEKRANEKYSPCELHHIDGDRTNHSLDNLILLCPNCHSLTDNYRAKNKNTEHIKSKDL